MKFIYLRNRSSWSKLFLVGLVQEPTIMPRSIGTHATSCGLRRTADSRPYCALKSSVEVAFWCHLNLLALILFVGACQ